MDPINKLKQDYPWIQTPLVVGAPMRLIALADMAVEISKAGKYHHQRYQNTEQQDNKLTLFYRRHRFHRRRNRRHRSTHPTPTRPTNTPANLSPRFPHPAHRHWFHQLGSPIRPLHLHHRRVPTSRSMVLRPVITVVAGRLGRSKPARKSSNEDMGADRQCEGSNRSSKTRPT